MVGTDSLNSQSGKKKGDRWQGETRNSVLGPAKESPTPHDTATSFQSDLQYPATASAAGRALARMHRLQLTSSQSRSRQRKRPPKR